MRATAALLPVLALAGCLAGETVDLDGPGDTDGADTEAPFDPELEGLDLLIVVDDSASMAQEQAMLATSVFHLLNVLAFPNDAIPYMPVDDLRVAVVSTNMGFSADGASGDGLWPGEVPPACAGVGDGGEFRITSAATVVVEAGVIPCAGSPSQCPPGWACEFGDACIGRCAPPSADATELACPGVGVAATAETTPTTVNPDLSLDVACLTSLGTSGCGFEQQLAAAAAATRRPDQAWFFRERAALGLLVVSDEDDCSMRDNAGLFAAPEVADQSLLQVNIACGAHPELLKGAEALVEELAAVKQGIEEAVFFGAIVGVPPGAACEGRGDAIGSCLEQPEMQLAPWQPNAPGDGTWYYREACARFEGENQVTKAYPGRRFVQLAEEFGSRGFVFSICNDDWIPAMERFGQIISSALP